MELWTEIGKLKGKTLRTLDRGNPFQVLDVTSTAVIVSPGASKKERRIERKNIESASKELMIRGEITRVTIQAKYSQYNPAYVAALLGALPGVSVTRSPIKLRYKRPTNS